MKVKQQAAVAGLVAALSAMGTAQAAEVKNVILMIGDGMGPQQVGLLETYARLAPNSTYAGQPTALTRLAEAGKVGLSLHHPADAIVVDSACSASQLATGMPARSETIGLDIDGNPVETVLERAKKAGKATGLVSDTRLTHATPAAFAAHRAHRSMENEIASDMLATGVDVMLSGGLRHWIPQSTNKQGATYKQLQQLTGTDIKLKSKRKDERNLLIEAQQAGYALAFDRDQLQQAKGDKVLGLFAYSGMHDAIRAHELGAEDKQPSLREMTLKALDTLSQDADGFFLMVEGGQIDWAGHANDTATMLHELLRFDEAVAAAHEWVAKRDDTLLVVTADHETGSFGFSYSAQNLPSAKGLPGSAFAYRDYKPNFNFGDPELLDRLYAQKSSFYEIFEAFDGLAKEQQTAASLVRLVNENSAFKIDQAQAERILARVDNPFKTEGHSYLEAQQLPKVQDFAPFYVYGEEIRQDLLGRELAADQNVVWGTGTHTSTPVPAFAYGPGEWAARFSMLQHHTEVGRLLMDAVD